MPVRVLPGPAAWAEAGAEVVLTAARRAVEARGRFSLVLAGGSTPTPLYQALSLPPWAARLPWEATHLFWGDERCVPPEDPRSNFGACLPWLTRLGLDLGQVHRILGEARPPASAAHLYEADLRGFFAGRPPVFDLVLLGLGADGHVASLFAASPALTEDEAWAVATAPPPGVEPAVARVSLTLPVINAARQVVFLVTGAAKASIVARALGRAGPGTPALPASLPVRRVRPVAGEALWLLDARCLGSQSVSTGSSSAPDMRAPIEGLRRPIKK
jgi:6-phosphogluconolactonase